MINTYNFMVIGVILERRAGELFSIAQKPKKKKKKLAVILIFKQ